MLLNTGKAATIIFEYNHLILFSLIFFFKHLFALLFYRPFLLLLLFHYLFYSVVFLLLHGFVLWRKKINYVVIWYVSKCVYVSLSLCTFIYENFYLVNLLLFFCCWYFVVCQKYYLIIVIYLLVIAVSNDKHIVFFFILIFCF